MHRLLLFVLSTKQCCKIRPTLPIHPVLHLELEPAQCCGTTQATLFIQPVLRSVPGNRDPDHMMSRAPHEKVIGNHGALSRANIRQGPLDTARRLRRLHGRHRQHPVCLDLVRP